MGNEEKLLLLRLQLYTAAQMLKGKELADFWSLLDEVAMLREEKVSDG